MNVVCLHGKRLVLDADGNYKTYLLTKHFLTDRHCEHCSWTSDPYFPAYKCLSLRDSNPQIYITIYYDIISCFDVKFSVRNNFIKDILLKEFRGLKFQNSMLKKIAKIVDRVSKLNSFE